MFNQILYSVLWQDRGGEVLGILLSLFFAAIGLAFAIAEIIAIWKIFVKAGRPGWASLIPFYNIYVMLEIVGRPGWWLLLYFVPIANVIVAIILSLDLAKSFGKDTLFGIGLILLAPIFILILGFGDARYEGPSASPIM